MLLSKSHSLERQNSAGNLRMARRTRQNKVREVVVGGIAVNMMNLQSHYFGLWAKGTLRACLLKNTLLQRLG
jgi:hypothetical protein